jgi:hypothetical protein
MKTIYNSILDRLNEINISSINSLYDSLIQQAQESDVTEEEKTFIIEGINETRQKLLANASLRWIDWDRGQLKKKDNTGRYPVAYPCALIRIGVTGTTDITDKIQDCKTSVTVTLAFDPLSYGRTAANAPEEVRSQGLEPYDVIASVYGLLQGYGTQSFDCLRRRSQSEVTHSDLFVYQIVFDCEFEDSTAMG